ESKMTTLPEFAQIAADHHYSVCTNGDDSVAGFWTATYQASSRLFESALIVAYPDVEAKRVMELWAETFDPIPNIVAWVREEQGQHDFDQNWDLTITYSDGVRVSGTIHRFYELQEDVFRLLNDTQHAHGEVRSIWTRQS